MIIYICGADDGRQRAYWRTRGGAGVMLARGLRLRRIWGAGRRWRAPRCA